MRIEDTTCDGCGFEDPVGGVASYENRGRNAVLCEICANSNIGNRLFYPDLFKGDDAALKAIGYVGNFLLKEIHALKQVDSATKEESPINNPATQQNERSCNPVK